MHVIFLNFIAIITHIFNADQITCNISNTLFSSNRLNHINSVASCTLLQKMYAATAQLFGTVCSRSETIKTSDRNNNDTEDVCKPEVAGSIPDDVTGIFH
jgi:hypothetical protein